MWPPVPSLRTGRASFPESSSSLLRTPLAGRSLLHHRPLAVNLPMTIGVQQNQVVGQGVAAVYAPAKMVDVPFRRRCQRLTNTPVTSRLAATKGIGPSQSRQGAGQLSRSCRAGRRENDRLLRLAASTQIVARGIRLPRCEVQKAYMPSGSGGAPTSATPAGLAIAPA